MDVPISLLVIIEEREELGLLGVPLGDKFKLAQVLATALMQLHASNWLRKTFRCENILFVPGPLFTMTNPYLSAWQWNLETCGQSSLKYYYNLNTNFGFSKTFDLYSLGVALIENDF